MRKLYYLLLCFAFSAASFGEGPHKATFSQSDLFQTGYFLKNVPGLITDYNGQPIRYFADHKGVCVFFTDAGPVYKLVKIDKEAAEKIEKEQEREKKLEIENDGARENIKDENPRIPTHYSLTTVHWIGANPHPLIEPVGKNTGTYNYLAGTPDKDLHSIVTDGFKKIVYHDVYPGIDVEYTFPDKGGIEYDLIVHPGADASRIKMEYGGAASSIQAGANGSMTIHTETGDILEYAPVAHMAGGQPVASAFNIQGTTVSFSLPAGYDHSSTLTIDPWVNVLTQLTVLNLGCDVDYDVPGNLYVYGAGGANSTDVSAADYEKVAKFNAAGTFLWVFNGSVPSVGWTTVGGGSSSTVDLLSNMKVDRIQETVYVGCAFDYPAGTRVIRLDNNGVYNNFISNRNASFTEVWSFVQNCATGAIIPMGGGITGNLNLAVITPSTGAVAINNFTGIPYGTSGGGFFSSSTTTGFGQDIVSGAEDSLENLFVVMASLVGTPQINNTMYQVNSTYNGKVWGPVATGFTTLSEAANMPTYDNTSGENSNNFNALAVNMSYLYYYDGQNLAAYNRASGARVGTATTVPGANPLWQGGIAVDRCNNIYVGQKGQILTYTFNGSTFTQGASISLGAGFTGDAVMDVRYNALNNLLYVTGAQFVGTYVAVPSQTCTIGNPYTDTLKTIALVSAPCSYPEAVITVTPNINNPQITYVWQDSLGNILQQTGPTNTLTDTFVPTHTGKYTIQIDLNANCGLGSDVTTFYINSRDSLTPSPSDTTICPNQPVTLTAIPCAAGGSYLWSPGGATTSSITVTPASSTNYIVTYTPLSGQGSPITDTIPVTVTSNTTVSVNSATVCNGQSVTLTATPSIPGGTYSWTPGGATTQSITVTPASNSTTTYTVTYTTVHCGTATNSGTITTGPNAGPDQFVTCFPLNSSATMAAVGAGTWTAAAGAPGTFTITTPTSPTTSITGFSALGVYTFIWTVGSCADTALVTVSSRAAAGPPQTVGCAPLSSITATMAAGNTGTWTVQPGNPGTATITNPSSATTTITSFSALGTYYFIWTSGGCSDTTSVTVTGTLTVAPLATNITCINPTGVVSVVASGTPPYTYQWSNFATTDSIDPATPGVLYTVTVTDAGLCTAVVSDSISNLIATVTIDSTIQNETCYGLNNGQIALTASPAGAYTYAWSNGDNTDTITNLPPDSTYAVTVTNNASGCSATGGPYIVTGPGVDSLSVTPTDTTITLGDTIQLGSTLTGAYPAVSYSWTPTNGLSCTNCPNPLLVPTSVVDTVTIPYILTVTYGNSCPVVDTAFIQVLAYNLYAMPDAFTPNGDGMNDTFKILAISVKDFRLSIYNRWGGEVFESTDINVGWDGTYKGASEPQDVYTYFFTITFLNGKSVYREGTLTLLR